MIARGLERRPAMAGGPRAVRRQMSEGQISWAFVLVSLTVQGGLRRLVAGDIVGFHPARRPDPEPCLGTRGNLARSFDVSTHESCLRRCQIRMREVVLLPIGHRELAIGVG